MCNDLPSNFELDCYEDKPEVACNCCFWCTFVNDVKCDSESEKLLTLDIYAGEESDGFEWKLRDEGSWDVIAAGGEYEDGEQINIQLCLAFPRGYYIATSMATPQPSNQHSQPITQFPTEPSMPTPATPPTPFPTEAPPPPTPFPTDSNNINERVCEDITTKKLCTKEPGGICLWDDENNICLKASSC